MTNHDETTRRIYKKQHERISGDADATNRILGMYENSNLGMPMGWFKGKKAIDLGCGNIGAMMARLANLGVSMCYGLDIGREWMEPLAKNFRALGIAESQYELMPGSVTQVPYEDESFDFVSVNGVLIHLENMMEIEKGFMEASRIARKGGALYTSWGPCGGLMQGVIFPVLRAHYRSNDDFKEFIDNIDPGQIHQVIDKVVEDSEKYGGEKLDGDFLKSLFGTDYCVFLQNFIQAPTWWSNECTPAYVEALYAKAGFGKVRRLSSFTKRKDIRKYFAPLHYDREYKFSKLLYGQGYVQYVGEKTS